MALSGELGSVALLFGAICKVKTMGECAIFFFSRGFS